MSTCNLTTLINGTDCIGDTRSVINQNFLNLDSAVCALSTTTVNGCMTPTVNVQFNPGTRTICADVRPTSITSNELASNSVTTVKVANQAITNNKIAFDGGSFCFRNKVINGAMHVWQRGVTFVNANGYTADRFVVGRSGSILGTGGASGMTVSQSSDVPTGPDIFLHSLKVQRAPGNTFSNDVEVRYIFETEDTLDCIGKVVTLSFYIKTGGTFNSTNLTPYFYSNTLPNQTMNSLHAGSAPWVQQAGAVIPAAPGLWQRIVQTFTIPTNARQLGFSIEYTPIPGVAGADESIYITGVQLEAGPTVTPFEYRLPAIEVNLCQRYFENGGYYIDHNHTTPDLNWRFPYNFKSTKRTAPIITRISGAPASAGGFVVVSTADGAVLSVQSPLPGTELSSLFVIDAEL